MLQVLATTAFPYIKLNIYKTVVTVDTLEKWKRSPKPRQLGRQFAFVHTKIAASAVGASAKSNVPSKSTHFFHAIHNPSTAIAPENWAVK
jgi:hypothetical protein